ncbi:YdcF family protein [Chitinibacter fontanus]|uniref:YdcF family protein n=1 Tax=Chitinibacter fontanus TaxID=1737446 RepID=A0A7D5V7V3_9NEIS|nr:YdcF family protein [Chitinibacter fontanus]QLI80391.1 YdcF family protein [Chitinibacter fontanus]
MDLAVLVKESLRAFLLPPGSSLLIITVCYLLRQRLGHWGQHIILITLAATWLLATPIIASTLMGFVERPPLNRPAVLANSQAMVILGGGKRFTARETLENETINNVTLARVRFAAHLARLHPQPILVSGGAPLGGMSEAHYMRQVLEGEFGIKVKWVEGGSVDTADNAKMSAQLLGENIKIITLVTSADHMARAQRSFEKQGFQVIAAPTDYINREPLSITQFLPRASALQISSTALREGLGQFWYALKDQ